MHMHPQNTPHITYVHTYSNTHSHTHTRTYTHYTHTHANILTDIKLYIIHT